MQVAGIGYRYGWKGSEGGLATIRGMRVCGSGWTMARNRAGRAQQKQSLCHRSLSKCVH